jgi:hypothetical protein
VRCTCWPVTEHRYSAPGIWNVRVLSSLRDRILSSIYFYIPSFLSSSSTFLYIYIDSHLISFYSSSRFQNSFLLLLLFFLYFSNNSSACSSILLTVGSVLTEVRTGNCLAEANVIERRWIRRKFADVINIRLFNLLWKYYGTEVAGSIFIKHETESKKVNRISLTSYRAQHCALNYKQAIGVYTFPISPSILLKCVGAM